MSEHRFEGPDQPHEVVGRTEEGHPIFHGPDGLTDADRPMPIWLRVVTYGTIAWGLAYLAWVPFSGWNQLDSFAAETAKAKAAAAAAPAPAQAGGGELAAMLKDPAAIKAGEEAYSGNCLACHGAGGAGGIGPALNDATWLYGGKPEEVAHTLEKGTAKGMPPFAALPATTRHQLVAYVKSLQK